MSIELIVNRFKLWFNKAFRKGSVKVGEVWENTTSTNRDRVVVTDTTIEQNGLLYVHYDERDLSIVNGKMSKGIMEEHIFLLMFEKEK